jgi:predicted nucleic acid-binding protein
MLHLLDTNVISNLAKPHPNQKLIGWLYDDVDPHEVAVPLSAIFEIQYGIELARECHADIAAEKEAWLENILISGDINVVVPTIDEARERARMCATPALRNFLLQSHHSKKLKTGEDLTIAAAAISHDACVVTFDHADFRTIHEHFPLPGIYHPGRPEWIVGQPNEARPRTRRNVALVHTLSGGRTP